MKRPPQCIPLDEIRDQIVGGKAQGLANLLVLGLSVPPGFVVVGATPDSLPEDLLAHYRRIGAGKVAVRSSAVGEDSSEASFAGQYDTALDVEGLDALSDAICACLQSTDNARAVAYRGRREKLGMNVVVQKMVDARVAGVLFTTNPINARRDQVIVDAVSGLGDSLVSGRETPDHWLLSRDGRVLERDLQGDEPALAPSEIERLRVEALRAEASFGAPLDLEWAIDRRGDLHWLQSRAITELPADPNELDTEPAPGAVYTWANIGEMMPGAVTPLTYSVTGRGIDLGMQRMYRRIGSHVPDHPEPRYVAMFFGHLFLNLETMAALAADVAGSTKAQMCLALCGRDIAELDEPNPASPLRRALNGVRYFRILVSAGSHAKRLDQLQARLSLPAVTDAQEHYAALDAALPNVWEAYELHLLSSASAGALSAILLALVARRKAPTPEDHATVARMLAGAADVESTDIAVGAQRIVDRLAVHPLAEAHFAAVDPPAALAWLQSPESAEAGTELARYLARHGHRAVRELELRQKGWAHDPLPVIVSLQSGVRARLQERSDRRRGRPLRSSKPETGVSRALVHFARAAVRCREHTKSALVAVTTHFKHAYRALGSRMVHEGFLPDEDAVFFLTHEELGACLGGADSLPELALARRRVLDYQMPLQFAQVFTGKAEPLERERDAKREDTLIGKPVSRGVVTGRARIVRKLEEAAALEPGEILVAPITDVGWTPYFSLIGGLATDVGSAVSHGAVVAREYGLPAVVNLRSATSRFRTGDRVVLDGDRGTLTLAEASADHSESLLDFSK